MRALTDVLLNIEEAFDVTNLGPISSFEIEKAFRVLLASYGYNDVKVSVRIDSNDGVAVKFDDSEGDSVVVLFITVEDNDGDINAEAIILTSDNTAIDLSPMDPPTIEQNGLEFIDLQDLSWMNKSVIKAILLAGNVGEVEYEEAHIMLGDRNLKLPIVCKSCIDGSEIQDIKTRLEAATGWLGLESVETTEPCEEPVAEAFMRLEREALEESLTPGFYAISCSDNVGTSVVGPFTDFADAAALVVSEDQSVFITDGVEWWNAPDADTALPTDVDLSGVK